jgi:hypothetical protein
MDMEASHDRHLGGLWILRDLKRQAWHDRIAGTHVVKVPAAQHARA